MASSPVNWLYDVFVSFRGEDVRVNFLSHFFKELDRKLITAFKDNEIKKSRSLWPELEEAIRSSRIAVVVFSKNYASSSWCLNELLEIVNSKDKIIIPVFYGLDPSHVRKQTGDFGKIFEETCKNNTKEVKKQWKKALTDVANMVGFDSANCKNEAKMIEEIATDVLGKLFSTSSSKDFDNFVGMEVHMANISELLQLESEEVRMVGIWGSSGIGKTTIARALFNQLSRHFQVSKFVDRGFVSTSKEIYSKTNPDDHNMKLYLQERFLSEVLRIKDTKIGHLGALGERLHHLKVLIIIDDLDDLVVLEVLADKTQWFGSGSRIIVVTNDRHFLRAHRIDHIYEVSFPTEVQARQMLCQSAFEENDPPEGFEKLVVEVARQAGSLPLGLKVLGKCLRGKDKEYWMGMLPRLHNGLEDKIEKILRISYNGLASKEDQAVFRHIACLFNHMEVTIIKSLLADSNLDVDIALQNLADKSLIHVRQGYVVMHGSLQAMGRKIVRTQFIDKPEEREFLVDENDIFDVLNKGTGTEKILGISLFYAREIDQLHFKRMHNLHFLQTYSKPENFYSKPENFYSKPENFYSKPENFYSKPENFYSEFINVLSPALLIFLYYHFYSEFINVLSPELIFLNYYLLKQKYSWRDFFLPPKLRLLSWKNYPMCRMPSSFSPKNLIKLEMRESKLEKLWEGVVSLPCLKEMNLRGSHYLEEIPDLSMATNLEKLNFGSCSSLVELPCSIRRLNELKELRIDFCKKLEILPIGINLKSLNELDLNGCSGLKIFPDISTNISKLSLYKTKIEEVPPWIIKFSKLAKLTMESCSKLKCISLNISKLRHLKKVNFSDCGALTRVHLSGYPSKVAMEWDNFDTVPEEAKFNFMDCLSLDPEALLQNLSIIFSSMVFSGEEVPSYFIHRGTGFDYDLSILLLHIPVSQSFFRFRACAVVNASIEVCIHINCQFKGRFGNSFDSIVKPHSFLNTQEGSYLLIFECCIPLNKDNAPPPQLNYDDVEIKIHLSAGWESRFKIKEWGIRLLENYSPLGDSYTLPDVCEADEDNTVNRTGHNEEYGVQVRRARTHIILFLSILVLFLALILHYGYSSLK